MPAVGDYPMTTEQGGWGAYDYAKSLCPGPHYFWQPPYPWQPPRTCWETSPNFWELHGALVAGGCFAAIGLAFVAWAVLRARPTLPGELAAWVRRRRAPITITIRIE